MFRRLMLWLLWVQIIEIYSPRSSFGVRVVFCLLVLIMHTHDEKDYENLFDASANS